MVAPLPELETRLFFDAPEGSFRNISLGVHNRNPARFDRMLELLVAARLRNLEPAVLLESANDFPTVHRGAPCSQEYTFRIHSSSTERACFRFFRGKNPAYKCA